MGSTLNFPTVPTIIRVFDKLLALLLPRPTPWNTPLRTFASYLYRCLRHEKAAINKKAQLSLTNPRDAKACQNCSNSTCLQRCRCQYWPIFMRLTAIASKIREIPRNSLKNSNLWSSRSSKVIDIGVNRKPICGLLLVISSNFSRICYRFRDIHG